MNSDGQPDQPDQPDDRPTGIHGRLRRRTLLAGTAAAAAAAPLVGALPASATTGTAPRTRAAAAASTASKAAGPILTGSRFPIGLFWPPPPTQTTLERYREIAKAGFTFMLTGNYLEDTFILDYALGMADQVGLDVLVVDPDVDYRTKNTTISDSGADFTTTTSEATAILKQAVARYGGTWHVENDALHIAGGSGNGSVGLTRAGATWTDYTFAFDLTLTDTDATIGYAQGGWAFRATDAGNAYVWLLSDKKVGSSGGNGYLTKAVFVNGTPVTVQVVPLTTAVKPGVTYRVSTTVKGSRITTSLNGTVIDTTTDTRFTKGRVGFREAGAESATFDNVVVTDAGGKQLFTDDFTEGLAAWQTPDGHPSFAGLVLFDEPSGAKVADIGKWASLLNGLEVPYQTYVNLLPGQGAAYVDQAKAIDTPVISFDSYPILTTGASLGYFRQWADFKAASVATGKPMWTFIQSTGYNGHAVPTKPDLLWQINISLAYGCQGIQYFTYWTPDPARGEGFHDALLSVEGTRRPLNAATKSVNETWLAPVGGELLGKKNEGTFALNTPTPPDGLPALGADDPVIAKSSGSPAYVGRFSAEGDAHQWVLVGNLSNTKQARVQLTFAPGLSRFETFVPPSGKYVRTQRTTNLALLAGAAVLLRVS